MTTRITLFAGFFVLLAVVSCSDLEMLPEEPKIEFESFTVFDTTDILGNDVREGLLKFYFEDGDGDIGLNAQAEAYEEEYDTINLFVSLFRINNGSELPAIPGDPYYPTGFRIPYMERTGRNKILKGHISVEFSYLFYTAEDSIKYEFFLKDRAGNSSNTVSTSVISINNKGIYEE